MKLTVRHELTFDLGAPPRVLAHLLLTPLNTAQQKVESWAVEMVGIKQAASFRDGFGNKAQLVTLSKLEGPIRITVDGVVETFDRAGVLGRLEFDPAYALFRRPTAAAKADPVIVDRLATGKDRIATLHQLMADLHGLGTEAVQMQTQGAQSQDQSAAPVELADSFVGIARALGFAARHITGYVLADGGKFHTWAEVWEDGLGWIGFDPRYDLCPADEHIRLASGLDSTGSVPVRTFPALSGMPDVTVIVSAG